MSVLRLLELRIPPPVVAATLALLVWLAGRDWPEGLLPVPETWRLVLAAALMAAGAAADIAGLYAFRKAKTTFNPLTPDATSAMVTSGIYGRTRNPMYCGLVLLLLAWGLYIGHVTGLIAPVLLAAYLTRFQIIPEERILQAKFGAEFSRYAERVSRWI